MLSHSAAAAGADDTGATQSDETVVHGRREANLVGELSDPICLHIGVNKVKNNIQAYTKYQVAQSQMLSDTRTWLRILRMLNTRSKGMFLWAVLVLKELEAKISICKIEEAILSLPEDRESVYERILQRPAHTLKGQLRLLCWKILKWLTLAERELRQDEVNEELRLEFAAESGLAFSHGLLYLESQLELFCSSLVTVQDRSIRLIHLTTQNYLQQPSKSMRNDENIHKFFVDLGEESARLTSLCTLYLSNHCSHWDNAAEGLNGKSVKASSPLIEYTCFNWIPHIIQ
jgi:hypothetical protein